MSILRVLLPAALILAWAIWPNVATADEPVVIHVRADGTGDYPTIQQAVDQAPAGAVVRIAAGVWNEALSINRPLTLEGEGWESTRIVSAANSQQQPNPELMKILGQVASELDSETQEKLRAAVLKVYGTSAAVTVKDTQGVILRNLSFLRKEAVRPGGFNSNATVEISDSRVQLDGCAILESPGTGLAAQGESQVAVNRCLIANCWGKGIVVGVTEQGSFEIVDSDIRNNQYSGLSIGSQSPAIVVKRCRIHGTGWHGIRYDGCAPTIEGNLIYRTAVSGIYASGKTAAIVKHNLFYHSGISCWFQNGDTIESNTFIGDQNAEDFGGITQGLQVLGGSTPTIRRNIFVNCENAVYLGDIGSDGEFSKSSGEVTLVENAFWNNERDLAQYDKSSEANVALPLPEGNREVQPEFVDAEHREFQLKAKSALLALKIGARGFATFDSPCNRRSNARSKPSNNGCSKPPVNASFPFLRYSGSKETTSHSCPAIISAHHGG